MLLVYIFPLIVSAVLGPLLAAVVSRRGQSPGTRALIALMLCASLWSMGYAIEIASPILRDKVFWAKIEYFGIAFLPVAWFMFSTQYLGAPGWLNRLRRGWMLICVIPTLTVALTLTNELHSLIWQGVHLDTVGPLLIAHFGHGPWFYVHVVYSHVLVLFGSCWLIFRLISSNRLHRWQVGLALSGVAVAWLSNLSYVTQINPLLNVDWTPFGFSAAGLFFSISLFRFHLPNVVPIAHRAVFEEQRDAVLVLDLEDRIIDANRAAQKKASAPFRQIVGLPISRALPELARSIEQLPRQKEVKVETRLTEDGQPRYFDLHILPISSHSDTPAGRLVVLHDITYIKQVQEQLEQAYNQLEDRVNERTRELTESQEQLRALAARLEESQEIERRRIATYLHDEVGQNLAGLNLNLQAIQNLVPPDQPGPIRHRLEESISLVEETTRQVRSVMGTLNPPLLEECGLVAALRYSCERFMQRTGIETVFSGGDFTPRLASRAEMALFRIVQEGLTNAAKHAKASRVEVRVMADESRVVLSIHDDGQGFDSENLVASDGQPHWGLLISKERVAAIGGRLHIDSAPGQGACIRIEVDRGAQDD